MEYQVVKKINFNKATAKKIGAFLYDKETDGLYFESPWPFPVQILITDGLTKCYVTPMFIRLPFILKGWINLDILLREIELLKLVMEDRILMHASCVDNTLIVGFPNSGKTYQTYKMVSQNGDLISEEYTILRVMRITDRMSSAIASPYKRIMRTCFSARTLKDCGIKTCLKEKIWLMFTSLRAWIMPFMFEAVIWKEIPASGNSTVVKKIVYGSTKEEVKDWKTFAILCENEFPFMSSEFLQAYAVATGYNLIGIQNKQRDLIKEFVNSIYNPA